MWGWIRLRPLERWGPFLLVCRFRVYLRLLLLLLLLLTSLGPDSILLRLLEIRRRPR